jgi:small basic protein (TIGR04137 family)
VSIHPSLNISDKDKKPRCVLKRSERLKIMQEKGQWRETEDVFGLPKLKTVRIKIKKEKAAKETTAEVAAGAAVSPAEGAATKEQAPAKGSAVKAPEKK